MTEVQEIKAAVGEDYTFALCGHFLTVGDGCLETENVFDRICHEYWAESMSWVYEVVVVRYGSTS